MIKNIIQNLKPSSTLLINEISKKLEEKGKEIFKFGFGQSPFEIPADIVKELKNSNNLVFKPGKEIHIKVTRYSEYGERYKLFVIEKNSFDKIFNLKDYGIYLIEKNNQIVVDTLKWNGLAKKSGFEIDDVLSELKIENLDRPNKSLVYPFAFIFLIIFGYMNYKRK